MRDVIYQYDGTLEGFFCCVFESYAYKEQPIDFCCEDEPLSLYEIRTVITRADHSRRVSAGIQQRSAKALKLVRHGFLTCMDCKEMCLYALVRKLFSEGGGFLQNLSDPVCYPVYQAVRHLNGELEKLRGFVRFSDYGGVLGAEIEPKNRVLPLLRGHFCGRYGNEAFFIYDRTHHELLFYANGRSRLMMVDSFHPTLPEGEELHFRALWKRFYETIAIKERENPRCQNTFLPKRYRSTMTEFLPIEHEKVHYRENALPLGNENLGQT